MKMRGTRYLGIHRWAFNAADRREPQMCGRLLEISMLMLVVLLAEHALTHNVEILGMPIATGPVPADPIAMMMYDQLQQTAKHDRLLDEEQNLVELKETHHTGMNLSRRRTNVTMGLVANKLNCSPEHGEVPTGEVTESARFMFCLARRSAARASFLKTRTIRRGQLVQKLSSKMRKLSNTLRRMRFSRFSNPHRPLNKPSADASKYMSYETASSSRLDEWVMTLKLGTPVQTFSGIIDTGSDLTWVQCDPCFECYTQPDPYFDPAGSSSYSLVSCLSSRCASLPLWACEDSELTCEYLYVYGDGSATLGELASETITLTTVMGENVEVDNFAFGCGEENAGDFGDSDGLVGLGQGPLSLSSQLGLEIGNRFSYCLVSREDAENVTSPLFFGDVAVPSGDNVMYTPIVANQVYPTYYYVKLVGISVGGTPLSLGEDQFAIDSNGDGGLILDSGTTITQLQTTVYSLLEEAFIERISYPSAISESGLTLCYDTSGVVGDPEFPGLTFHFDGADIALPVDNYFVPVDNENTFCLTVMSNEDDESLSIFGNWQQQNFWVFYDVQNARIGFKPTICDQVQG